MSKHKYPIRYMVQFGDFTAEEVKEQGFASCDQMMICSVVKFEDGKGSIAWHSTRGVPHEQIDPVTAFKAWVALAAKILNSGDLNNLHREILLNVVNSIQVNKI